MEHLKGLFPRSDPIAHANDFVLEKLAKIYEDDGLVLIIGWYDHRNQENGGKKALGVHWGDDYPQSRGVLSLCVIPSATRNAILSSLLHQAVSQGQTKQVEDILDAIRFFNE